ncbi:DUF7147 family protein [Halalkalibacter urbisdiaboli]|uniref:DUF7147 family protein n=1 Tax=Halalkalibacter urbisdiaboli TaxID=1960589 RepID=UPI000B43615B|nr:methylthioribose kinase [Halalkalibacter urbisdiaboli]
MIQRFIELGEGYSDIYELIEIAKSNKDRIHRFLRLDTTVGERKMTSTAVVLNPAAPGNLMPIYICREGIVNPDQKANQRYSLFLDCATDCGQTIHQLEIKNSQKFEEKDLFYQYLIGILRMNRFIPPLS